MDPKIFIGMWVDTLGVPKLSSLHFDLGVPNSICPPINILAIFQNCFKTQIAFRLNLDTLQVVT